MTILITGASGSVGHNILKQLMDLGEDIRVSSRNPQTANFPDDIESVTMDLDKPETLANALKGITKVFLYAKPEGINEFVKEAINAGVQKIVLLSSSSVVDSDSISDFNAQRHLTVEKAIEESGLAWTFLRPGAFATNSLSWSSPIKYQGKISLPYPMSHSTPIHEVDIATVAVKALTTSELECTAPVLTGPESLTQKELVEIISKAIDKTISFEEITPEEAREFMINYLPLQYVDIMLGYWSKSDGKPGIVSDMVEKITGKQAKTFAEWANDHAADFM